MDSKNYICKIRSGYNPYFLNGENKIEKIYIFRRGDIVASFNWLGSNNKIPKILLDFDIKRLIGNKQPDFNKVHSFYKKSDYKWADKGNIDLYIHADLVNLSEPIVKVDFQTTLNTRYKNEFTIDFICSKEELILNPNYKGDNFNDEKYIYQDSEIKLQTFSFDEFSHSENRPIYYLATDKLREIEEKTGLKELKIDLESLAIILQNFNIEPIKK